MSLQNRLWVITRYVRLSVACDPGLAPLFYRGHKDFDGSFRGLRRATTLVVDAFPRSANSFFARRLIQAQHESMQVAHHLHAAGILVAAVRRGIPAVTIIRNPSDAIVSFAVYLSPVCGHVATTISLSMREYIGFYQTLIPIRDRLAVISFDHATKRFHDCVDTINRRLEIDLRSGRDQPGFEAEADALLLRTHRFYDGADTVKSTARKPIPDRTRKATQDLFRGELSQEHYEPYLKRAQTLYGQLCERALDVDNS